MKLIVNAHKIELIQEQAVNEKEIDISECQFEFADEITNEYVKEAYFTLGDTTYKQIIVNNKCSFPQEVLVRPATIELGVVAYLVEDETEIKRYNPTPVYFKTDLGSLKDAENSEEPTPSEMEQYEQALQDGLTEVNSKLEDIDEAILETSNLNITAEKTNNITYVTITDKEGNDNTVQILDGETGPAGRDGTDGQDGADGITPTIGDNGNWFIGETDTGKPSRGATGQTGPAGQDGQNGTDGYSPIANVSKSGSTATITITDKNGTTTATINDGTNGTNGQDGVGVPSGGTQGQVLSKIDGTDYNTQWINVPSPDLSNYYTKSETKTLITTDNLIVVDGYGTDGFTQENVQKVLDEMLTNNQNRILPYFVKPTKDGDVYTIVGNYGGTASKKKLSIVKTTPDLHTDRIDIAYALLNIDVNTTTSQATYISITNTSTASVLSTTNTQSYTPTANYHPATKKYVDDAITSAITDALGGNY